MSFPLTRGRAGPPFAHRYRATRVTLFLLLVCLVCSEGSWVSVAHGAWGGSSAVENTQETEPDYYAVLGLEEKREDATEREIKTAWRKLSKKHHPDIAGEEARVLYQTIQRAYEVLGDRRKRKIYDILGEDGLKNMDKPQPSQEMNWMFQAFGGVAGGGSGSHMEMILVVPLEDLYSGGGHTVTFQKTKICRACRGSGAKSPQHIHTCTHCAGKGSVIQNVQLAPGFVTRMEQECQRCGGAGKIITMKCPVCSGKKMVRGTSKISVDVEAGMPEGVKIVYDLEADQQPGQVPGDVYVYVESAAHPRFERRGLHLYTNVTLTLKEALLGFEKRIEHLDGHPVLLESSTVTQHLQVEKVSEEGMPQHHVPSEKGNLYVTYIIEFPLFLTEEQKRVAKEMM